MFAPLRLLLSALSLGRFPGNPVHDEVRPDSKALQSRVRSPSAKGPSSCSQLPKTGCFGRSSWLLVGRLSLSSAGCDLLGAVPNLAFRGSTPPLSSDLLCQGSCR